MNYEKFADLFTAALEKDDRTIYIKEYSENSNDIDILTNIWDNAHMTVREILKQSGMTQAQFSKRFCIPLRTIENWVTNKRKAPDYIRLLLEKELGLLKVHCE